MHLYDSDALRLLHDQALFQRTLPPWVRPDEIETDDVIGDAPPEEALADYWMTYLYAAERDGNVIDAPQVVTDFIEMVTRFGSSYPLSMMSSYIGRAIRQSDEKAALLRQLEDARQGASQPLQQAWHDFMLECREDAEA